jgi:hypothetical protein
MYPAEQLRCSLGGNSSRVVVTVARWMLSAQPTCTARVGLEQNLAIGVRPSLIISVEPPPEPS